MTRRPFGLLGASILTAGATMLALSLLVLRSERGAVTAIAIVILGLVFVSLGQTKSHVPPSLAHLLAQAGYDNTARLIEELGFRAQGVYLPAIMCGGQPRVALLLNGHTALPTSGRSMESRLLARSGTGEELVLLVSAPGSYSLDLLDTGVGTTLDEAATALITLACGTLGLATGVSVSRRGASCMVTFENCLELQQFRSGPMGQCLGSPLAGIAATVMAEALRQPVRFKSEERAGGDLAVALEPLDTESAT